MTLDNQMWIGTIYGGEMVTCPQMGADISPVGNLSSGSLLDGGGFSSGVLDSHREYSFSWSNSESQSDIDKIQRLRDGWHSRDPRDLIFFIDPFALRSNALPKRWAQPSIMLTENSLGFTDTLMGRLTVSPNRSDFPSAPNLPQRAVRVEAPYTSPTRVGGRALFVPSIPGETTFFIPMFKPVPGNPGSGMFGREVRANGTFGPEYATELWEFILPRPANPGPADVIGWMFYIKGVVDYLCAALVSQETLMSTITTPEDFPKLMRPGMGHSGCRFVGNPTIIGTSAVMGNDAYLGYATSLIEVGDWYQ